MRFVISAVLLASLVSLGHAQSLTDQDDTPPVSSSGGSDIGALTIDEMLAEAEAHIDDDNPLMAKSLIRAILLRDENNIEAALMDAELALAEGDTDRARTRYRAVIAIEPNDFDANLGLGKLYARTKLWRQAKFYLERAANFVQEDEAAEVYTMLARAYRGTGEAGQALDWNQQAIQADGEYLPAWQHLIKLRTEGLDFDRAIIEGEQMIEVARSEVMADPSDQSAIEALYGAYSVQLDSLRSMHQAQYEMNPDQSRSDKLIPGLEVEAAEALRRITDLMIVQAELLRTISYFQMLTLAEKAVTYDPKNLNAQMQYGLLLRNTAQYTKAREAFEAVLGIDPSNMEAKRQLATLPAAPPSAEPDDLPTSQPAEESPTSMPALSEPQAKIGG